MALKLNQQPRIGWRTDTDTLKAIDRAILDRPHGKQTYQSLFDELVHGWLAGDSTAVPHDNGDEETARQLFQWFENPPSETEREVRDLIAKWAGISLSRIKRRSVDKA